MTKALVIAWLLVAGCGRSTSSAGGGDAATPEDGGARQCGDGVTGVTCGTRVCPRKAWCDTTGTTPVCRCGADVTNKTPDCICSGTDPNHPGCGSGPAGCA